MHRSTDDLVEDYLSKANPSLPFTSTDKDDEEPSAEPGEAMAGPGKVESKGAPAKLPPPSIHESSANLDAALSKISHLGEKGFRSLHPGTQQELLDAGFIDANGYLTAQGHQEVSKYFAQHAGNPKLGPEAQQHAASRQQAHAESATQGEGAHEHWKAKQVELKGGNSGPAGNMPPNSMSGGPGMTPNAPPMAGKPPMPIPGQTPVQGAPSGSALAGVAGHPGNPGQQLPRQPAPGAKVPVSLSAPNQAPENMPPNEGAPTARGMVGKPPMMPGKPGQGMQPPQAMQMQKPGMPGQPMPAAGQPGVPPKKPMPPQFQKSGLDSLGDYLEKAMGGEREGHKYIKREGAPGYYKYTYAMSGQGDNSSQSEQHRSEAEYHANSAHNVAQFQPNSDMVRYHEHMSAGHEHMLEGRGHAAAGAGKEANPHFAAATKEFNAAHRVGGKTGPVGGAKIEASKWATAAQQAAGGGGKEPPEGPKSLSHEALWAKIKKLGDAADKHRVPFPHSDDFNIVDPGKYQKIMAELEPLKQEALRREAQSANERGSKHTDKEVYGKDVTPEEKERMDQEADATWELQHPEDKKPADHGKAAEAHQAQAQQAHTDWQRLTLDGKKRSDPEVLAASSKAQHHHAMADYHLGMKFANETDDPKEKAAHKNFATQRQMEAIRHEKDMGVQEDLKTRGQAARPGEDMPSIAERAKQQYAGWKGHVEKPQVGTAKDEYKEMDTAKLKERAEVDPTAKMVLRHRLMREEAKAKQAQTEKPAAAGGGITTELLHGTHGPLKDLMHKQTYLQAHQAAVRSGQDFASAIHAGKGVGGIGQTLQEKHQRHLDKLKGIVGKHGYDVRTAALAGVAGEVSQYAAGLKAQAQEAGTFSVHKRTPNEIGPVSTGPGSMHGFKTQVEAKKHAADWRARFPGGRTVVEEHAGAKKSPKPAQGDLFKRSMSGISELGDYLRKSAEQIPGGLAEGKPDSDFDANALAQGIKVEMEHTDNKKVAKEISKDHLMEDPHYYTKLAKMEKSIDSEINSFLQSNPKPDDSEVHALAGKLGMEVDDLEERIYAMAGKQLQKSEGEGSRGGHVIGHGRDGNPIYESHKQVKEAFVAHNAHKEDASFNENYNTSKKLGSVAGRGLMENIANSKHGHAGGRKKITWPDVENHLKGRGGWSEEAAMQKSGLNELGEYLKKSDGMPSQNDWDDIDKPNEQTLGESANGGDLTEHGSVAGNASGAGEGQDKQGQLTGVPEGQQETLGDDRDPAKQMTDGESAIEEAIPEGQKSMTPAGQRQMVAREHAQKVAELTKSNDVQVGFVHPLSNQTIHGNTDAEAEALLKSDFYYGASPTLAQPGSMLRQTVLCKSENCGCKYPAMLTSCPSCGEGITKSRMLPRSGYMGGGDAVILEKSSPLIRPARVEADEYIPGPSPVLFRQR